MILRMIPQIDEFLRILLQVIELPAVLSVEIDQLVPAVKVHGSKVVVVGALHAVIKFGIYGLLMEMGIRFSSENRRQTLALHKIRDFQSGQFHQGGSDVNQFYQRIGPEAFCDSGRAGENQGDMDKGLIVCQCDKRFRQAILSSLVEIFLLMRRLVFQLPLFPQR